MILFLFITLFSPLQPSSVQEDLKKINIPPTPWMIPFHDEEVLDVAIIGGGMSGMAAYLALLKEGVTKTKIFDENPSGCEGPWAKSARMEALRSDKYQTGPSLGIPSLTFCSWYEEQFGKESWEELTTAPTNLWSDYLCWFRHILQIPIENQMTLRKIIPLSDRIELHFDQEKIIQARKVVLATGREGSGGLKLPKCLENISKTHFSHTGEMIDPELFNQKRIVIIGAGSSAFDAAGMAIENGALSVEMLVRRSEIVPYSKTGPFNTPGMENGFHLLPDEMRCFFYAEVFKNGIDPSEAALERVKDSSKLSIHYNTHIEEVIEEENELILRTNHQTFHADYIIAATGYEVDLTRRQELDVIHQEILLWKSRAPKKVLKEVPQLKFFPYLGPSFEFLEDKKGEAPYLKNIYCFNYGAILSHGAVNGGIAGLTLGATRLAQGIAADFFLSDSPLFLQEINSIR